jgi:nucleotide-binding universal stress UspA family protein
MNKIYACIDGSSNTAAVVDWAAWCAMQTAVPLELLHVLEKRPERAVAHDLSGAIGLGSQELLLNELTELDARRSALEQQAGSQLLAAARQRASAAGALQVEGRMRHDELIASVLDLEPDARLFVLGQHSQAPDRGKRHLDHHVERVIRAVKRPVLVAGGAPFVAPERFVIAFDGSATAVKMVNAVAHSPLLAGMGATLVRAGKETPEAQVQMEGAEAVLRTAGFAVNIFVRDGEPEDVLPEAISQAKASLLVMGAYGHGRIRQLIVGSATTTLLRLSAVPVLILR